MGMRDNKVWLVGPMSLTPLRELQIGELRIPVATGTVRTHFVGGRRLEHSILLVGRQAVEAAAFAAEDDGEAEVAVDGWLFSVHGHTLVVVDNISFVAPPQVRRRIRERMRSIRRREAPQVQVSPELVAMLIAGAGGKEGA
ncbi:MAG: hypothetical protein QN194_15520 [Armatimonadota bacterium]|nr:hypothetical protein [Armatimonadota bacterium]